MLSVRFLKYTVIASDSEGKSHFREVEVDFQHVEYEDAQGVELSSDIAAAKVAFARMPKGLFVDYHPAPNRQFFCCLTGKVELTVSGGERRIFQAGDVFLTEDTSGMGHQVRVIGETDFVAIAIPLQP